MARIDQPILNQIIVGKVFTVDDQIKDTLDNKAKMYSHQNCFPNIKPGNIIINLTINAKNSMVFALFQYSL